MRELYVEEQMSQNKIKDLFDCSISTVGKWLDKHGIEKRDRSEAAKIAHGSHPKETPYLIGPFGAEVWKYCHKGEKATVFVHRLVAVAEYGFDAVAESAVHHKNGIRWDNRPDNLELMRHGDHTKHHKCKLTEEQYEEIVERYENEDVSTYDLAEEYPLSPGGIGEVIRRGGAP